MAYYKTGSITATGTTTVTGTGTAFVANAKAGDALIVNGAVYEIVTVASDTSMTVDRALTVTGSSFLIMPVQGYMKVLATQVDALLTKYDSMYTAGTDVASLSGLTLKTMGTAGIPAIRRSATDTDTGLYWVADNELGVAAGGARVASFTPTGINNTAIGATTPLTGAFTSLTTTGQMTVGGNLVVNGTTVTVNSTTQTLDDPILTLGGDTAPTVDDNKDRGIEFRWHNGTSAKVGFFGIDDSTGKFTFIPDGTNASEVFSGTVGPASFGALDVTTLAASGAITATGGLVAYDNSFSLKDNTDNTKVLAFDVGTLVTTGTTRTLTVQDLSGQIAVIGTGDLNSPRNSDINSGAYLDAATVVQTAIPVTNTAISYTFGPEPWLIVNYAGTCTVTLPNAANNPGRCITIKTLTANAVVSAVSDVAPLASATAGTAILAATAGKWARLVSNGTNWVQMEGN